MRVEKKQQHNLLILLKIKWKLKCQFKIKLNISIHNIFFSTLWHILPNEFVFLHL